MSLSVPISREFFHQARLSTHQYPNKHQGKEGGSLFHLFDTLMGFLRLPYLLGEIQEIYQRVKEGESLMTSKELRYQGLSTLANLAEVLLWFYERAWVDMTYRKAVWVQGACHLFRMIVYEQAIYQETFSFIKLQKDSKDGL